MGRMMDITNDFGITFRARIVKKGDSHGLKDCLVYEKVNPKVEFYDTRNMIEPNLGQFVSEYFVHTLIDQQEYPKGLVLDVGIPAWRLSQKNMKEVRRWLKREMDNPDFHKEEGPYRLKGLKGKKVFMIDEEENEIKKVILLNNHEEEIQPRWVRVEMDGHNGPVGVEHVYATQNEAENELKKRKKEYEEKIIKNGIIQTLFDSWANEYPYGQKQMNMDVMRELIQKQYGIELKKS